MKRSWLYAATSTETRGFLFVILNCSIKRAKHLAGTIQHIAQVHFAEGLLEGERDHVVEEKICVR